MVDITLGVISGTSTAMVDISDDCIQFIVTGTVEMRDITVIDHYEDVSVTGSVGHITFHPYMAGSCASSNGLKQMMFVPNDVEINLTMKDVTELSPHSFLNFIDFTSPQISMSANMIWSAYEYVVDLVDRITIHRSYIHCPDLDASDITIVSANNPRIVAVSDRNVFICYQGYDSKFHLVRADFPEAIAGDAVITELYSWNDTGIYNGINYEADEMGWMVRCKYEAIDKLVITCGWTEDDADSQPEIGRVVVWDLVTDTLAYDRFLDMSANGNDLVDFDAGCPFTAPGIYEDKVVFAARLVPDNELVGNYCPCPTFTYHCNGDVITGWFNYIIDAANETDPWYGGSISKLSGYYYFCLLYGANDYRLMQVDPSSGISLFQSGANEYITLQSETNSYTVVDKTVRKNSNFNSVLCTLPADWPTVIDERNQIAWVLNDDELLGKSLLSLADKSISIDWVGGTIPYTYVTGTFTDPYFFGILCGNLVMNVVSSQSYPGGISIQNDYYVLAYI